MNIFFLDLDPRTCASYHCDKHAVKMIVEYGQLLSTAHRVLDGKEYLENRIVQPKLIHYSNNDIDFANKKVRYRKIRRFAHPDPYLNSLLYKATHINHPSAIWVRENEVNYQWLWNLLYYLSVEYSRRYKKIHAIDRLHLLRALSQTPTNIGRNKDSKFPFAMPEDFINRENVVQSYRDFYNVTKSRFATWKFTDTPFWYVPKT